MSAEAWGIVTLAWIAAGAWAGGMLSSAEDDLRESRRTRHLVIWAAAGVVLLGAWYFTAGPGAR